MIPDVKYSMIKKTPKRHIYPTREKGVNEHEKIQSLLEDYLITHCIHYKSVTECN